VTMADDALVAGRGLQVGMLAEKVRDLGLDCPGQQRARSMTQDLGELVVDDSWRALAGLGRGWADPSFALIIAPARLWDASMELMRILFSTHSSGRRVLGGFGRLPLIALSAAGLCGITPRHRNVRLAVAFSRRITFGREVSPDPREAWHGMAWVLTLRQ
jgi:hypothetical protein